jgi:hypothetical protein
VNTEEAIHATARELPFLPSYAIRSIGLMATSSFRELEPSWREALARLHDEHFFKCGPAALPWC